MTWRTLGLAAALGSFLLVGAAGAQARDRDDDWCRNRIRAEERDLNRAIRRFGFFSRQAQKERRELQIARSRCSASGRRGWDRDDRWQRDRRWDRDDRGRRRNRDWDDRDWRRRDHDRDRDDRWYR